MLRYLAGVVSALLLVGAGVFLFKSNASPEMLPKAPAARAALADPEQEPEAGLPEASARTREQKRFDRYDKDRDAKITRDEYLISRRKAYAKLDANGDGRLSFDEWVVKTATKFATADRDQSGTLTAPEFATTAVKRSPRPRCACPTPVPAEED